MVFLVLYIKEHTCICVIKKMSLKVDFNTQVHTLLLNAPFCILPVGDFALVMFLICGVCLGPFVIDVMSHLCNL